MEGLIKEFLDFYMLDVLRCDYFFLDFDFDYDFD